MLTLKPDMIVSVGKIRVRQRSHAIAPAFAPWRTKPNVASKYLQWENVEMFGKQDAVIKIRKEKKKKVNTEMKKRKLKK